MYCSIRGKDSVPHITCATQLHRRVPARARTFVKTCRNQSPLFLHTEHQFTPSHIYSEGNMATQSCDLSWSRPFAPLCRGQSPVKVERPFEQQLQIAKATLVCAALIILGCGGLGAFSPQAKTQKHVNNFAWSHSCTDPQNLLAQRIREALELCGLAFGIPVRGPCLLYQPYKKWIITGWG